MAELNHNETELQALAHAYLHGDLDSEKTEAFEIYLMEHPEMIEQLELDSLLKTYIEDVGINQTINMSKWQWFAGPRLRFGFSLGITFVLGTLISPFINQETDTKPMSGNIEIAYVSELRGNADTPDLILPLNLDLETLIFVLQPSDSNAAKYSVSIEDVKNGRVLFSNIVYQSNNLGEILVPIRVSELNPSTFQINYAPLDNPTTNTSLQIELTSQNTLP